MPWTVNPDHGYLERFDTGQSMDAVLAVNVDLATPPGTDPVVPDVDGDITVTGGQIPSGSTPNVIRTHSTQANQYVTEVQQAGSAAAQNTALNGVAHFDSEFFSVVNGFVSFTGTPLEDLTITPDVGGAVSPVVDNINLFGQDAGTVETVVTHNITGDLKVEDRTWQTQYVVDPSATVGLRGTFQTIQAALDQALADGMTYTSPRLIYVRYGSYTENLTIYGGAHIKGESIQGDPALIPLSPTITGTHSLDAIAIFYLENIYFNNISASDPTFGTAATACIPFATNCVFNNTGTGRHFQEINFASGTFRNCTFNQTSFQEGFFLTAQTYFYDCTFTSTGFDNQSVIRAWRCTGIGPVVCTNGSVIAEDCSFSSDATDNISGTGSGGHLTNCQFSSNNATTVAVSSVGGTWYLNNIARRGATSGPTDLYTTAAVPALIPALSGNIYKGVRSATNYVIISDTDFYIGITSTAAARTVSLPTNPALDAVYIVKDESGAAGTNNITIDTVGAPLIDGAATKVINTNYGCYAFQFDGTNYFTIWSTNELAGMVVKITTPGAYPYTALTTDYVILVDSSSARTINLIAAPVTGTTFRIKDNSGLAGTNNITVSGNGNNIDGAASYTISSNYDSIDVVYNGTQWNVL